MTIPQSGCRYAPPCQRLAAINVFTWRFCGFPKGTLRKVASLTLLTRSPLGLLPPLPKGGRLASGKPRGDFALVLLANGKENRWLGHRKNTALCFCSPRTAKQQVSAVLRKLSSPLFGTHNGCPLCYEVPYSSSHKGAKDEDKLLLIRDTQLRESK